MQVVSNYEFTKVSRIDAGDGKNSVGVWLADDPALGGQVAVKEIAKADFRDPDEYFSEARKMFASDHPNVVSIRLGAQTADSIYLVMPYYKNGSLAARVRSGPLPVQAALKITREVLAGAGAIHAGRSVHLDIKPTNVLFGQRGEALVADFGQARTMRPGGFAPLPDRLYIPHIPPECWAGNVAGVQADIFQIGLTLYRCLNGDDEFFRQLHAIPSQADLQAAIANGDFPKRDVYLPHISLSLRKAVNKALNPDMDKRFQSAFDFSNALAQVTVKHNWHPVRSPDGEIQWTAERRSRPDLVAMLTQDSSAPPRWSVEWFTSRAGKRRRTMPNMCRNGVSRTDAMRHLRQSFQTLERA
ncbi:serine/threonine-protein kinase [Crateriforma conspicua]|uniref:Serine/threonine-protein kinase PrkC n=1 Tax=Crateriforma conspicua TaxID=2527996 RepID=A0A5C6FNM2_9PLAN|nr:serine/threonine-protein kinase [Crateriforma conspicua]TWU61973.1 Serine/threonine-protein kinase PrkC [Crateriforma conspicua]